MINTIKIRVSSNKIHCLSSDCELNTCEYQKECLDTGKPVENLEEVLKELGVWRECNDK